MRRNSSFERLIFIFNIAVGWERFGPKFVHHLLHLFELFKVKLKLGTINEEFIPVMNGTDFTIEYVTSNLRDWHV